MSRTASSIMCVTGSPCGDTRVRLLKRRCDLAMSVSRKLTDVSDAPTTTMRALMVIFGYSISFCLRNSSE